jgi:hypothetical protein
MKCHKGPILLSSKWLGSLDASLRAKHDPKELQNVGIQMFYRMRALGVIWCLCRQERLWEKNAFEPDRFAPETVKARHRYAYLPFSTGPHVCCCMGFTMLEMTTILAIPVRDIHSNRSLAIAWSSL